MKIVIGVLLFLLAHIVTWFQLNGQFLWEIFKKNPILISISGILTSYLFIKATQFTVKSFDGLLWPPRFIGFGVGIIVYAILVSYFFNEGISLKTFVSLLLSLALILIQLFWK